MCSSDLPSACRAWIRLSIEVMPQAEGELGSVASVTFPAHGPRGPVTARYRVTVFPTVYVIDAAGRIAWRDAGALSAATLAREVRRAARRVP